MSADCIGGKMLVALAEPRQIKLACPVCGATGLARASVINGHGVIPYHKSVPFRSSGVVATERAASTMLCPSCGERHDDPLEDCPHGPLSERGETILRRGLCCGE